MLIEPDKSQLGDTHLSPQEALYREREKDLKAASVHRIYGQDELEQADRSSGPRMYYTEILRRIWKINPEIMVKEGVKGSNGTADSVAIYRPKRRNEIDWEQFDPRKGRDWRFDHEYVTGMQKTWIPEYSSVTLDSSLLPTRELRGWRTVLITLIESGALPYKDVVREFGDPAGDRRSTFWFEYLKKYIK